MDYSPTYWKILKITNGEKAIYKVLAHWLGDLQYHDTYWRLNSGITKVVFNKDFNLYEIHGHSGSVYHCLATNEHISGCMISTIEGFRYRAIDTTIEPITIEEFLNAE